MAGGSEKKARGKHRLDKFYQLAKDQGYRSRAAFKLIQLNKKYGFLNDARAVLDLCAAPGGWLQVCSKHLPLTARIIGVDLVPIRPIRGVKTLTEDITSQKCRTLLHRESEGSLFDVVLHDGAPNVGGAFATEMYTQWRRVQSTLVLDALRLACDFLKPDGTFVSKIFRSRDYTALMYAFRQLFKRVDATKPQASRSTSAEIFVVCTGYKAPGKIDPRLLDHRTLFQDLEEAPKAMGPDALLKSIGKKHRHRSGYETGTSLLHKTVNAVDFIRCKDPMPALASGSAILLEPPSTDADPGAEEAPGTFPPAEAAEFIAKHKQTVDEVRALCGDLQVLGRSEFKQLLRWRMKVKKDLEAAEKARGKAQASGDGGDADMKDGGEETSGDEETGDGGVDPQDTEDKLIQEMEGLKQKEAQDIKRSRRKRRELKRKANIRAAQAAQTEGIGEEQDLGDDAMFSLSLIKGAKALVATGEAEALDEEQMAKTLDARDSDDETVSGESEESLSGDEAAAAYDADVEAQLDAAYESYLQRRHIRDVIKAEKRKRARLADAGDVGDDAVKDATRDIQDLPALEPAQSDGADDDAAPGGGLIVGAPPKLAPDALTHQWFSQPVFQYEEARGAVQGEEDLLTDDGEDAGPQGEPPVATESSDDMECVHVPLAVLAPLATGATPKSPGGAAPHPTLPASAGAASDDGSEEDDEEAIGKLKESAAVAAGGRLRCGDDGRGFEEVPQSDGNDSTDTEDEFEAMGEHAQAEVRALARKWLQGRKGQMSLMEAAYNRYTFDDAYVPRWLREDEARHYKPPALVSREEIEAEKEALRAIDARPLKKVAEAKLRKRRKVMQKLKVAREKAETIADGEDMSSHRKAKEINKLYAKAKAAGQDRRAKRSSDKSKLSRSAREKAKRKGPPLDRRMIADKMKGKAKALGKKGVKRKGKAGGKGK